jgi:O-acetyl-ADP-ribose deacetylase (regulator of RNase III)
MIQHGIEYRKGDATRPYISDGGVHILAHIVNNSGRWGAGFTRALNRRFAGLERDYREWHGSYRIQPVPAREMLGKIRSCWVSDTLCVVHMCAQNGISYTGERTVDYIALSRALQQLALHVAVTGAVRVHMPRIGAGLGGGDWTIIGALITDTLIEGFQIPVTVYDL